jgi:hypothetical protein
MTKTEQVLRDSAETRVFFNAKRREMGGANFLTPRLSPADPFLNYVGALPCINKKPPDSPENHGVS